MSANIKASVDGTQAIIGVGGVDQMTVSNAGVVTANSFVGLNGSSVTATGSTTARTLANRFADVVNVKDFGAVGDGVANETAAFNLAAATGASVYIPLGTYLITAATSSAKWILGKGVVISGLPNAGTAGGGVMDTSRLTGSIISENAGGETVLRVGDSDPWLTRSIRDAAEILSTLIASSPGGDIAGCFSSRSSDDLTQNMNTIGVASFGVNDNTTTPEPTWSIYAETVRFAGAGPAFGAEMDFVNLGNTNNLTPYSAVDPYSAVNAPTANLWLSCGGGTSGLAAGSNNISAAIVTLPNIKKFNVGWVVRNNSIETADIILAPQSYKYKWHDSSERVLSTIDNRQHFRAVYSNTLTDTVADINRKYKADGVSATTANDVIYSEVFQGISVGGATFNGAGTYVIQSSNFSGGSATFTLGLYAANQAGGTSDVGLNSSGAGNFAPLTSDNALTLGTAAHRFSVVFAGTGTINTSDAREKQDIEDLSEAELRVAKKLKSLIKKFRFKDAVAEKGDAARIHVGIIAQDVKEAFESENLDGMKYGILCYDEWDATEEIKDEKGTILISGRKSGNRYGVRYDELLAFIISAI